jgi:hypothetical protein
VAYVNEREISIRSVELCGDTFNIDHMITVVQQPSYGKVTSLCFRCTERDTYFYSGHQSGAVVKWIVQRESVP